MVGCLLFVVFVSDVLFLDVLFDSGWCSVTPIVTCHLITGCTSEFHFCSQPQNPRVICSLQTKARAIYSCLKKQVSTIQSFPANLGEAELRAGQLALARRRGGKVQRSRPRLRQSLCWVYQETQVPFLVINKYLISPLSCNKQAPNLTIFFPDTLWLRTLSILCSWSIFSSASTFWRLPWESATHRWGGEKDLALTPCWILDSHPPSIS